MSFIVGCSFFYSVIIGFPRYHRFPPFTPLGTRTNVMPTSLVAGPFLISHYFLLLRFLLQKPLVDFPVLGGPRRLVFVLSFSKASSFQFFKPTFWLPSLLSFVLSELIPFLLGWKIASLLPSWFFFMGSPKYQGSCSWVISSQAFWLLFYIIGWLIETCLFLFLVSLGTPPWTVLIQPLLCCMSWGSQASRNPRVSRSNSFPRLPSDFLTLAG